MAAAFDSDVEVIVEAGFGFGPLAASPTWVDISQYVKSFSCDRGRSTVQTEYPAGTATLVLKNVDGRFYPFDTGSPYSPNVRVATPIRVRTTHAATTRPLFRGHVADWGNPYPTDADELTDVALIENGERLARKRITATLPAASTDDRIGDVLDAAGWPAARRDLDAGVADLLAIDADTDALTLIRDAAKTESGDLFFTAAGDVRFTNRLFASGGISPAATFGPAGADLTYIDVSVDYNDDLLFNEATIGAAGGVVATYSDATSVANYGPVTFEFSADTMPPNEAADVARWAVERFKDVAARISGLVLDPAGDPTNLWPVALALDLRSVIDVKVTFPGASVTLTQTVSVEQVSHSFEAGGRWTTTLRCHPLSEIETRVFWEIGVSRLDSTTRLA